MTQSHAGVNEVMYQELHEPGHMDITQSVQTYHLFLKLVKWSMISIAVVLILMAAFVA